jgi:hypothetical protein
VTPSSEPVSVPYRQIRATYTDDTLRVYQAYSRSIADPAVCAGRLVAPFKRDRMTWIKPSFLWMMYRSGWATKPGQEHVLAVDITRDGFEWALGHASLSNFEAGTYADHASWLARKAVTPVRIQWDPERDLALAPMEHRAIQIGISGDAVRRYVDGWIVDITDVTPAVREIAAQVSARNLDAARAALPDERPYPLTDNLRQLIGAT